MTSILKADNISTVAGTGTINVAANNTLYAPGHVIQFKKAETNNALTSWNGTPGASAAYGVAYGSRTYTLAETVTITPTSTSSILYCTAYVGWSSISPIATQAIGSVITLNDTSAIDNADFPLYPMNSWSSNGTPYWPKESVMGTFSPASTSEQTIRLRPFVYNESGTANGRFRYSGLFVMEIAQ